MEIKEGRKRKMMRGREGTELGTQKAKLTGF